jgi:hypothetical protein
MVSVTCTVIPWQRGKTEQMTDLFTGISGITEYSPRFESVNNNDIVYSYYRAQKYTIYNAKVSNLNHITVDARQYQL